MANNNAKIRLLIVKSIGRKRLPSNMELDHIIPKWAGGTDRPINLQLLSTRQHQIKTAYENAIMARLKNKKRKIHA